MNSEDEAKEFSEHSSADDDEITVVKRVVNLPFRAPYKNRSPYSTPRRPIRSSSARLAPRRLRYSPPAIAPPINRAARRTKRRIEVRERLIALTRMLNDFHEQFNEYMAIIECKFREELLDERDHFTSSSDDEREETSSEDYDFLRTPTSEDDRKVLDE